MKDIHRKEASSTECSKQEKGVPVAQIKPNMPVSVPLAAQSTPLPAAVGSRFAPPQAKFLLGIC
jgi:hypothetical protein